MTLLFGSLEQESTAIEANRTKKIFYSYNMVLRKLLNTMRVSHCRTKMHFIFQIQKNNTIYPLSILGLKKYICREKTKCNQGSLDGGLNFSSILLGGISIRSLDERRQSLRSKEH
jgi:hypothetical protein